MILEKGNMWDAFFNTNAFMITTNPIITRNNEVVMGRGIALEAKTRYPSLAFDFARQLQNGFNVANQQNVGYIGKYEKVPVYYFMVKDHWKSPASLKIIEESVFAILHDPDLSHLLLSYYRVDLNFPGIGNGRLNRDKVLPLINRLPDNFHIWEFE